jgi:hypothetical protein
MDDSLFYEIYCLHKSQMTTIFMWPKEEGTWRGKRHWPKGEGRKQQTNATNALETKSPKFLTRQQKAGGFFLMPPGVHFPPFTFCQWAQTMDAFSQMGEERFSESQTFCKMCK